MTRTDIHRPTALVTEDYVFVGAVDFHPDGSAHRIATLARVKETHGSNWSRVHGASDQCNHCGAHLRYAAIMRHVPTGELMFVGETCLDNRFGRATAEFHAMRKQAELDRAAQRIKTMREAWIEANTDVHAHMVAFAPTNSFYSDLLAKLNTYGELTENQTNAVARNMQRDIDNKARREADAARERGPVPTGRVVIEGTVLSTKWVNGFAYDQSTLKMLVELANGSKVWGTVPSRNMEQIERGVTVAFTATVEASKDDESFGFFKRPTVATVTKAEVAA